MITIQNFVGTFFLVCGLAYAAYIVANALKNRSWKSEQPGNLGILMAVEAAVFFFATLGISDFVMNTIVVRKLKLAKPENLPDCLIAATIMPGTFIAFLYLRGVEDIDAVTFITFLISLSVGSFIGSQIVGKMNGDSVRKALVLLLSAAVLCLIGRMVMDSGSYGTATSLSGVKLVILGALAMLFSCTNMLGIPAKPFLTTALLLIGLSPIATLTLILGAMPISGLTGGIAVMKKGCYNVKHALSAVTAGCAAAFVGCSLAISIDATVLNIILIGVIIIAIVSLIKK